MFSKPIFKQSVQANWKLWLIITIVASIILSGFIMGFDAAEYASLASAAEGTSFSNMFASMTSLLGSLENFYKLIGVILGIVYVVFTANSLVVNEVDSGSMAYTLSTPIKRSSVIFTKSLYLIGSVILMYTVIAFAGLGASQMQFNNVTGYPITDDVQAAAEALNQDEGYISERLYLIQDDEQAMREAATARDMDTEAYEIYLETVINDRSYEEAAEIITDERYDIYEDDEDMEEEDIEITGEELAANPAMILDSNDALNAGSKVEGISVADYRDFINNEIKALEEENKPEEEKDDKEKDRQPTLMVTDENAEMLLQNVVDASAGALNVSREQVSENLTFIKQPEALKASTEVTGLNEKQVITMANQAMVSSARTVDKALEFDLETYFWLSLGLLLLILSMSSISFFASTIFNRTEIALAVGGGIPFAFFLITMIQQLMDTSDVLNYVTITSLFDTGAIYSSGDFGLGLVALGVISLVLYGASNYIFTKKDLPL